MTENNPYNPQSQLSYDGGVNPHSGAPLGYPAEHYSAQYPGQVPGQLLYGQAPKNEPNATLAWVSLGLVIFPFTVLFGFITAIIAFLKSAPGKGTPRIVSAVAMILGGIFLVVQLVLGFLVFVLITEDYYPTSNVPTHAEQSGWGIPNQDSPSGPIELEDFKGTETTEFSHGTVRTPCFTFKVPVGTKVSFTEQKRECEVIVTLADATDADGNSQSVYIRPLAEEFTIEEATEKFANILPENGGSFETKNLNASPAIKTETPTSLTFGMPTTSYYVPMLNKELTYQGKPVQVLLLEQPKGLKSPNEPQLDLVEEIGKTLIMRY